MIARTWDSEKRLTKDGTRRVTWAFLRDGTGRSDSGQQEQ